MMTVYAIFLCVGVNQPCTYVENSPGQSLQECQKEADGLNRTAYDPNTGRFVKIGPDTKLAEPRITYVCMSKTVRPEWAPATR